MLYRYETSNIDVYNDYMYYITLEYSERIEFARGVDDKMRDALRAGITFISPQRQSGDALQYASDELKNNREIVLSAVRQNGDGQK